MKSRTIDSWDEMVKSPPKSFKEYFKEEEIFLIKNISKKDIVLDLGCGTGRAIKIISPISDKVIGIDNDKNAIRVGKENIKGLKNSEIKFEDAEKTSFKDNTFDVVFIGLTFVNFGDSKFNILKEIKRILKENGRIIFSIYNENSLEERLKVYKIYDKRNLIINENGIVSFDSEAVSEQFSKEQIIKILEDSGFRIKEIKKGQIFYLIKAIK